MKLKIMSVCAHLCNGVVTDQRLLNDKLNGFLTTTYVYLDTHTKKNKKQKQLYD